MADDVAIESITDPDQIRIKLLASGRGVHAPLSALDAFYQAVGSYQPLDADLTSWAAITRASGFDTFTATPSSANLAALLTDESGTDKVAFITQQNYTPTVTASAGTFTSVTAISGSYTKIGPLVIFTAQCTLTTIGTASANLLISLPFTAGTGSWVGAGTVAGGNMVKAVIPSGGTIAGIVRYDGASIIAAGATITITASYWV